MTIDDFPLIGFLRLKQIIGDKTADPPVPPLVPISRTAWLDGVKAETLPPPIRLTPGTFVWRVADVRYLLEHGEWVPAEERKDAAGVAA